MSINHILANIPDEEKLNVKFGDIYYDNLIPAPTAPDYTNLEVRAYEQMAGVIISGTTGAEQSLFYVNPNSIGSNIVPADSVRKGSKYRVYARGNISTDGANQVFLFRTKIGNAVLETQVITLPNLSQGSKWTVTGDILVLQTGNPGVAIAETFLKFEFVDSQGKVEAYYISNTNNSTFQTTTDAPADMTIAWDTNSENNQLSCSALSFSRIY